MILRNCEFDDYLPLASAYVEDSGTLVRSEPKTLRPLAVFTFSQGHNHYAIDGKLEQLQMDVSSYSLTECNFFMQRKIYLFADICAQQQGFISFCFLNQMYFFYGAKINLQITVSVFVFLDLEECNFLCSEKYPQICTHYENK